MPDDSVKEIFTSPEKSQKSEELSELVTHLEAMSKADARLLYDEEGKMLSPRLWPDEVAFAVDNITPHASSGGYVVRFANKTKAIDMLSRLKGLLANEDEVVNPLEQALEAIPRNVLVEMRDQLKHIANLHHETDD